MNREESLAKGYLETLKSGDVVFEPAGNIPPDLLIGGNIAVEVTRLNQVIEVDGRVRRLDDDSVSIISSLKSTLANYKSKSLSGNYRVTLYVSRPFGKIKKVRQKLISFLDTFAVPSDIELESKYKITDSLSIKFKEHSACEEPPTFQLHSVSQAESGGWVFDEVHKGIEHCIGEKSAKIEPYKDKYSEWWLILIDTISYGSCNEYEVTLKEHLNLLNFSKVIVLGGLQGQSVLEISQSI